MRQHILRGLMVVLFTLTFSLCDGVVFADQLDDGYAAYNRGDYATAFRLWRPLAEKGDAFTQFSIGLMYAVGQGVPQDYKEAVKWLRLSAAQKDAAAQFYLGSMYERGHGVLQDFKEAAKLYRLAATQGDAEAQSHLGFMYDKGLGVSQSYDEAAKLYKLAATQGVSFAQLKLALLYAEGKGVPQDHKEAVKWYRSAAEQGNVSAQHLLGLAYELGDGVTQDFKEAAKWYRLASAQGSELAQYNLGLIYRKGNGVTQDFIRAHMWWNVAAAQGYAAAVESRDNLSKQISPQQLLKSQAMARKCEASHFSQCDEPITTEIAPPSRGSVPMTKERGAFAVPVLINNTITLNFTVDSGASDVSIPADVVSTLVRSGTIEDSDFIGTKTYVLADGSKVPSRTFRIRSLKVGDRVFENVDGSVAPKDGSLLLGQSLLGRFKSWSIDNTKHALIFE